MTGKTVHIKSFGCQMNKLDTAMVKANNKKYRDTDKEFACNYQPIKDNNGSIMK
jgi:tRNA A37 methylthiotransferase MiaB